VHDAPVTAAGKNNRRHVEEILGRSIAQKMQHVPYALQKSVLEEIEQSLPDEVRQTAGHQFRHPGDLAHPSTPVQLAFLLAKRHCDVFCLNDTDSAEVALAEQAAMMADFLPQYFPFRSPFELPDDVAEQRAAFSATALALAARAGVPVAPRQGGRPAAQATPA
jgi:hypothetical protein